MFYLIVAKSYKFPGGESFYMPSGHIELHIGKRAKGNKHTFFKLAIQTIWIAKQENRKVFFYTWHVSEEDLRERFQDAIIIKKTRFYDKLFLLYIIPIYCKFKIPTNPFIKCLVDTSKLPDDFFSKGKIARSIAGLRAEN